MPPLTPWHLLFLAIAAEVLGTACLRLSAGMTRPLPTLVLLPACGTAMLGMALIAAGVVLVNLGAASAHG